MTQPAKVQEPSMEEILASIRRIIADDEAKPPGGEKPAAAGQPAPAKAEKPGTAAAAPKPPVTNDVPPSKIPAPVAASAKATPAPLAASAAPAPGAANSQDDIDALLNGLDESTPPGEFRAPPSDGEVFELTDDMAVPSAAPPNPQPSFHKIDPEDDLEFTESTAGRLRSAAGPAIAADPVANHGFRRRIRLQYPGPYGAQQQCTDAGGPGQGDAAADAEILARRQFAGTGRAHRESRNRTGLPRPVASSLSPDRARFSQRKRL